MMWGSTYGRQTRYTQKKVTKILIQGLVCRMSPSLMHGSFRKFRDRNKYRDNVPVDYSLLLHLDRYQHKILLATGRISDVTASDNIQ
jgi:hypothetical protein